MRKSDKIFKYTFFITFIVVIISFSLTFYFQLESMKIMENFLSSASVAGFVAIFAQFSTTLVQEYYKRKTYKICMLCKKSQFSLSIASSVREYYSKELDVVLHVELLEPGVMLQENFNNFLSTEAYDYDGLIIRPLDSSDAFAAKINILLNRGKKIILTDLNLTKQQLESFNTKELPFYVGSDFKLGGSYLANHIKEIVNNSARNTNIILFLGPSRTASARKRGKELIWKLSINNINIKSIVELDSFNIDSSLELFNEECKKKDLISDSIIIFCANDNIASKLIEISNYSKSKYTHIQKTFTNTEHIVFLGYDGIKNIDETYQLSQYNVNYATVDVDPSKQGEISAKIMLDKLMGKIKTYSTEELVEPKFIKYQESVNNE